MAKLARNVQHHGRISGCHYIFRHAQPRHHYQLLLQVLVTQLIAMLLRSLIYQSSLCLLLHQRNLLSTILLWCCCMRWVTLELTSKDTSLVICGENRIANKKPNQPLLDSKVMAGITTIAPIFYNTKSRLRQHSKLVVSKIGSSLERRHTAFG
ncbi:hypothetical protein EDB86DRAFT_2152313 [Lactarius hatsudake]|nr:hypothetical protein EDB86DRAFT_2152313 [Lactarius hatsudake]